MEEETTADFSRSPPTDEEIAENCRQITREFSAWVDPLAAEERRSLDLFSGLVEELEGYDIFQDLLQHSRIDWRLQVDDGTVVSGQIEKLNETDLKAFVPLARLFTQKRERASIRKIGAIFDKRVSQRHPIWWEFNAHRVGLQQFLALTASNNRLETFSELVDVFINGHYVHREDAKEAKFESWKKDPGAFINRKVGFLLALGSIFSTVRLMRNCAKQLLEATTNAGQRQAPKKELALPSGLTEPLFSDQIVSLDMHSISNCSAGMRISISESLIGHLLDFLGHALAPHIRPGHIGELKLHEYGQKRGDKWLDRRAGASLMLPVSWMSIARSPGLEMTEEHSGRPIIFVRQEFFDHLKRVDAGDHEWELVL